MQTVIINNREALVQGQLQPKGKDSNGMAILGDCVTFYPGANLVDTKVLEALHKNETFQKVNFDSKIPPSPAPEQNPEKVGKPTLEFLFVDGKSKEGKPEKKLFPELEDKFPLAKLTEDMVLALVEEVLLPDTLRQWLREESRAPVRYAIEKQLAKIGAAPAGPAAVGR